MFLSRNKKNNVCPCKPQFYYIKVGFNGVKIIQVCFCDETIGVLSVISVQSIYVQLCSSFLAAVNKLVTSFLIKIQYIQTDK